jgi:hypothetical protein
MRSRFRTLRAAVGVTSEWPVVQHSKIGRRKIEMGQTRSFGDVGSMSDLPESGHGWRFMSRRPPRAWKPSCCSVKVVASPRDHLYRTGASPIYSCATPVHQLPQVGCGVRHSRRSSPLCCPDPHCQPHCCSCCARQGSRDHGLSELGARSCLALIAS